MQRRLIGVDYSTSQIFSVPVKVRGVFRPLLLSLQHPKLLSLQKRCIKENRNAF